MLRRRFAEQALRSGWTGIVSIAYLVTTARADNLYSLVSGDTDIWTNQELIHAYQVHNVISRPSPLLTDSQVFGARLNIVYLPHLLLYLLSHAVEMFVIVRYYTLLAINRYILGNQEIPTLYPKYLMSGDLFKLQPGYVRTDALLYTSLC